MQKQKINTTIYLALQNSYDDIVIALFCNETLLAKKNISKILASKDLINSLDLLLMENNLTIDDITFLGVNQGPGPFTTLRVVIVTANALNFAGSLPLVGIDGLDALILENEDKEYPLTVALLNAYNNDVYFAIQHALKIEKGWQNITDFLNHLKSNFPSEKIRFIGNGVELFKNEIIGIFKDKAKFEISNPQTCSIEQIAKMAFIKWEQDQDVTEELTPFYLKNAVKTQNIA